MIDTSRLKSPCYKCPHLFSDKMKSPCSSCIDRVIYDAILCGISKEEFESWYETQCHSLQIYRCSVNGCYRRVSKEGLKCNRCDKTNGNFVKRRLESEEFILKLETLMKNFVDYCEEHYDNLTEAAKEFGVNPTYIYTIKNYEIYPSKSMAFAMQMFIQLN